VGQFKQAQGGIARRGPFDWREKDQGYFMGLEGEYVYRNNDTAATGAIYSFALPARRMESGLQVSRLFKH
jgi:hypothetical protein